MEANIVTEKAQTRSNKVAINVPGSVDADTRRIACHAYDVTIAQPKRQEGRPPKLKPQVMDAIEEIVRLGLPPRYEYTRWGISDRSWRYYETQARTGRNKALTEFFRILQKIQDSRVAPVYSGLGSRSDKARIFFIQSERPDVFIPQTANTQAPDQHLHVHLTADQAAEKLAAIQAAKERELQTVSQNRDYVNSPGVPQGNFPTDSGTNVYEVPEDDEEEEVDDEE